MFDSREIANEFIELAKQDGENTLTPMQLIKLTYIAHGWMLGLYNKPLIRDEIQAWQYGPVIPRLYNAVRKFKGSPVSSKIQADETELPSEFSDIINQVYQIYGRFSGPKLSNLTHAAGTPWDTIYEPGSFGLVITNDLIESHYESILMKTTSH